MHQVGAYAQNKRRREMPVEREWEASDLERSRVAGVAQGRGMSRLSNMSAASLPRGDELRLMAHRIGGSGRTE